MDVKDGPLAVLHLTLPCSVVHEKPVETPPTVRDRKKVEYHVPKSKDPN